MDMELYKEIIEQLKEFPHKITTLNFAWLGEPLLHPQIAEMVKLAKDAEVAETVSLVTNGSMLTHEMSDKLIAARLDRLRISLQGLTKEDYWEISKYKINYEEYLSNIQYFYDNKKDTLVYIKILDALLKTDEDENKFREMYEDKCDVINIEHLIPLQGELDISDMKKEFDVGYYGDEIVDNLICSYCFFAMVISPEGIIMPCADADSIIENGIVYNMSLGDVKKQTIREFWNGEKLKQFRLKMIEGKRKENPICANCAYAKYHIAKADRLDGFEDRLKRYYGM